MEEIVCPHCSIKIPVNREQMGPDDEFLECPGCGMLVDIREMGQRRDEMEVETEWRSARVKRKREVNVVLAIVLFIAFIAGVSLYVYWILNRYK